jgi:Flp pilus assembly pilin Flp
MFALLLYFSRECRGTVALEYALIATIISILGVALYPPLAAGLAILLDGPNEGLAP